MEYIKPEAIRVTFTFKTIDHIQLAAPKGSEETARKFFKDILGLHEVEKPELLKENGGVWFSYGNCHIHIGIEDPFLPAKKAHPAFEVNNCEELKKHLIANGIDVTEDNRIPNAKRFHFSDPFGNRIEIIEWILD